MNRYLAGAAAAATVVLTALAGWALFGPRPLPAPPAPGDMAQPAAAGIAQYGRTLGQGAKGLQYVGTAEALARPRQGYQLTFAATDPQWAKARDDAANAARQAAWQRRFCTEELAATMEAQGVDVVTGRVVDGNGRTQYVADCVAGQPPRQAGPGGPLL